MILKFNDATELQIQSAERVGQGLRILAINTTPEQLRTLFSDKVKTKNMKVEERGQLIATYENYTEYDHTEEYPGQIYGIVMNQVGKSMEERLADAEGDIENTKQEIEELKENGGGVGIDRNLFDATVFIARENAQAFSDSDALKVKSIYEKWEELVKRNFTAKVKDFKFTHEDILYKTLKENQNFQAQWVPGQGTESIFIRIDEEHTGTKEDPIPYHVNMEVFKDKYYTEEGILYRCTRDSGQALHNKASELVGHYFEIVA